MMSLATSSEIRAVSSRRIPVTPMVIAVIALLLGRVDVALAGSTPCLSDIQSMRETVEQHGIPALLDFVRTRGLDAPVMPSAWHLERIAPAESKPLGGVARQLGYSISVQIDAWAPLMSTLVGDALLEKARFLVDLAHWVGPAEGYGNSVLAGRAREVAVVGLARLVADANYPVAEPAAQTQRCRAIFDEPAFRARILNREAGGALFPVGPSATAEKFKEIWRERAVKNLLATPRPTRFPPPGAADDPYRDLPFSADDLAARGLDPRTPDRNDTFFVDDRRTCPDPVTTTRCWDYRWYESLLSDSRVRRLNNLESLVKFRQLIGNFPEAPASKAGEADAQERAFIDAGLSLKPPNDLRLGAFAWDVFEAVKSGQFVDSDTGAVARYNQAREWSRTQQVGLSPSPSLGITPTAGQ